MKSTVINYSLFLINLFVTWKDVSSFRTSTISFNGFQKQTSSTISLSKTTGIARNQVQRCSHHHHQHNKRLVQLFVQKSTLDETTEKYGLEIGLVESLKSKDGGESAKSLLKRYGIAYLATSIPLALLSFGICYFLVDQGMDMSEILQKFGIESNTVNEKASTVAIAYAAHKALSPIRFPPTVLLTPMVAKLIGKEPNNINNNNENTEE